MRWLAALSAAIALATPLPAVELARGAVDQKIVCRDAPSQQYALFLPAAYDGSRKWPIVYVMDARGHALAGMATFREAAADSGVIVASSWNSASDGPMQPNVDALRSMWDDTHERLSIDDRRVYAAGFSGTARAAVTLASAAPGAIAGVIAAGAGYPEGRSPAAGTPFVYFATVGTRDFNYAELQELEGKLKSAGIAYRIEEFDGGHQWMPPALAKEALDWLALQSMKQGTAARDQGFIERAWRTDAARAAGLPPVEAERLWGEMTRDYAGLRDVSDAAAQRNALAATKEYRRARSERDRALREEADYLASAQRILGSARSAGDAIRELQIARLRERRDPAAARMLNALEVQTGFYLPREMMRERHDYRRAVFFLTIAGAIDPDDPQLAYALARANALGGWRDPAIRSLERAVALGFHDAARLETEEDLASLRNDPAFLAIVAKMKKMK